LTPINPMSEGTFSPGDAVRPWDSLSDDEKRLFSRMAELYAGMSEYADAQVGRIVDYLEECGQLENTLILYCADNGASGEGSPNGSVNEGKFMNAYPDRIEDNLPMIDQLGSPAPTTITRPAGRRRSRPSFGCQALLLSGRRLRPPGDPLAQGDQGHGRGPKPVSPLQ
jgi:arylsulfatase A-like enzyme